MRKGRKERWKNHRRGKNGGYSSVRATRLTFKEKASVNVPSTKAGSTRHGSNPGEEKERGS